MNLIFGKFGVTSDQEIPVEVYPTLEVNPALKDNYIDINYAPFVGAFSFYLVLVVKSVI